MKVVAMIPARIGSKRVHKKNLRLLNGRPLISYAIDAAKSSGAFDEIYLNTDSDEFKEIAEDCGISYYKRPVDLGSDETNNDQFAYDFISNVDSTYTVQLLPTSPLITPEEIQDFVETLTNIDAKTVVSVESKQIAAVYRESPINFHLFDAHKPSQTMIPVCPYATVLMGWESDRFLKNMKEHGTAYHGPTGGVKYFVLSGFSTIDIDDEEDFALAEVALKHISDPKNYERKYYQPNSRETGEEDVKEILTKDGIENNYFGGQNQMVSNVRDIIKENGANAAWSHRFVNSENNSATLISQMPGEGNRLHYHPDWNEWWYIVAGEWEWEVEGERHIVQKDDIVFIEKGKWHKITAVGKNPAIRLAVSKDKVLHVYKE